MQSVEDKRAYSRCQPRGLHVSMLSAHDAVVDDISVQGMRLTTRRRLVPGAKCRLKMWNEEKDVFVKGVIAWCILSTSRTSGPEGPAPIYTAGIQLVDGTEETTRKLAWLIETTCIDDQERRRFSRIPISEKHSVDITSPVVCRGVQINRGGMLVETLYHLSVGTRLVIDLSLDGQPVKARCKVINRVLDEETGITQLGLEFQHFDARGLEDFFRFMEKIEAEAGSPRSDTVH